MTETSLTFSNSKELLLTLSNTFSILGASIYFISILFLIIYIFKHTEALYDIGYPMTIAGGILMLIGNIISSLLL